MVLIDDILENEQDKLNPVDAVVRFEKTIRRLEESGDVIMQGE